MHKLKNILNRIVTSVFRLNFGQISEQRQESNDFNVVVWSRSFIREYRSNCFVVHSVTIFWVYLIMWVSTHPICIWVL